MGKNLKNISTIRIIDLIERCRYKSSLANCTLIRYEVDFFKYIIPYEESEQRETRLTLWKLTVPERHTPTRIWSFYPSAWNTLISFFQIRIFALIGLLMFSCRGRCFPDMADHFKSPDEQIDRWNEQLQAHHIRIACRKGTFHRNSDLLSRRTGPVCSKHCSSPEVKYR